MRKLLRKKKRHEPVGFTPEGLLKERTRERVWMPMAGVALSVVLVGVFGLWMVFRPETKSVALPGGTPPGRLEEIKSLVGRFMAAGTPEEVLLLIREPGKFETSVREWCVAHPAGLPPRGTLLRIVARKVGTTRLAEAAIHRENAPNRNFLVVETPEGWRLDWRTFTGMGELSLPQFIAKKPSDPTLLMSVARASDYYNGTYSDPAAWQCLHITDDTGQHSLYAYVARRNATLMEKIARLEPARSRQTAELNRVSRSMALRVHVAPGAAGADPLQAEVDAVEGEGWYVP